jgi:hypothetical protein
MGHRPIAPPPTRIPAAVRKATPTVHGGTRAAIAPPPLAPIGRAATPQPHSVAAPSLQRRARSAVPPPPLVPTGRAATPPPHSVAAPSLQRKARNAVPLPPLAPINRPSARPRTGPLVGPTPAGTIQRRPFVTDPQTFQQIDLGAMSDRRVRRLRSRLRHLEADTPYQLYSENMATIRRQLHPPAGHGAGGPALPPPGPVARTGAALIVAQNQFRNFGTGNAAGAAPLIADHIRDEAAARAVARSAAEAAAGFVAGALTGGLSGMAHAGAKALVSMTNAGRLKAILTRAEALRGGMHSNSEDVVALIGVLSTLAGTQAAQSVGHAASIFIPMAGSAAGAAVGGDRRVAIEELRRLKESSGAVAGLAGEAFNVLVSEDVGSSAASAGSSTAYGSTGQAPR